MNGVWLDTPFRLYDWWKTTLAQLNSDLGDFTHIMEAKYSFKCVFN